MSDRVWEAFHAVIEPPCNQVQGPRVKEGWWDDDLIMQRNWHPVSSAGFRFFAPEDIPWSVPLDLPELVADQCVTALNGLFLWYE
ncbi:hypothetical protein AXG93_948s1100 [Marchantia polymorpha subsp. ruderalis]|uniref:Uncharacterized protein n=1 Tax=Marchantia polymorpha subsp. ruderalis TaxID=1480154 RepID=A0A176VJB2_MARPO|nr:hypothetical protein AXG93_948s1100 [Marchantia polymorpha subsp. ruderalis]